MAYLTGDPVTTAEYNTFVSTVNGSVNGISADLHPGATNLAGFADYGYGLAPLTSTVTAGAPILASEWAAIVARIKLIATHQGATVVPPLPASGPAAGDPISAYNTPTALATILSNLTTNRFVIAVGQSTLTTGTSYAQPGPAQPWTTSLTFNFNVDFGSWNNARYFFNSGGNISINGSTTTASWITNLTNMSPLVFNYTSTTPGSGSGGTAIGFYDLTTSYQVIYNRAGTGYIGSYTEVRAKLAAAAGTNGIINFQAVLAEPGSATPKTGATTFRIDNLKSSGAVVYPGPAVSVATVGANSGFVAA